MITFIAQSQSAGPLVKSISVKVDEQMYTKVKALAASNNTSMAQVVRDAIGNV